MASQTDIATELLRNKLLSTTNFLNYTGLTYKDIVDAINTRLSQDRTLDNFRESAIAQTMLEMFAGTADLVNYLLERRAEESFFDTAKLPSSIIRLARNLAYDIQRPVPATSTIKMKISGDIQYTATLTSQMVANGTAKIQIPQYTKFSVNGKNFILKNLFSYTILASDIAQGADYSKEIILSDDGTSIELIQGEIKYAKFASVGNDQHNEIFQTYLISDPTFSNMYGDKDYDTGVVTQVGIGADVGTAFEASNIYTIDRRSLLTQELVNFYDFNADVATSQKICLIRTATDGGVEIKFGDDKYVAKGLKGAVSTTNNIFVQYLSTLGLNGNEVGVIGQTIDIVDAPYNYGINVEFTMLSNIIGGSNLESNESIKVNAPGIYYSLDRLVTSQDYVTYLESLTSPININNAIAWGEQEELTNLRTFSTSATDVVSIQKLFNVVLFSCVASLYTIAENESAVKTDITDVVLDSDYNEYQLPSQNYMNVFVTQNVVQQVKLQQAASFSNSEANQYTTIVGAESFMIPYYTWQYNNPTLSLGFDTYNKATNVHTQLSAFSTYTSAYNDYPDLATAMQTAIINLNIWDYVSVEYASNAACKFRFKLLGTDSYAVSVVYDCGGLTYFNPLTTNIMFMFAATPQNDFFSSSEFAYSMKIDQVISLLNKRSQLTVKNVYISPIIQDFNLNGNVYVKQLANRDNIQKQINDKIYLWLDDNADFKVNIYLSDLTKLITEIPGVLYTDLKLEPKVDIVPAGTTSWLNLTTLQNGENAGLIEIGGTTDRITCGLIIYNNIIDFVNKYQATTGQLYYSYTQTSANVYSKPVYDDIFKWSSKISERLFYSELVYNIVTELNDTGVVTIADLPFTQTANFFSIISYLHKDLLFIILYNMLDSNGNIAAEYEVKEINGQSVDSYVRGGYSMGNEIARININTTTLYKS
jgi:hypothetical protein